MTDINTFDGIDIGLASSRQIRAWSSGEVLKPETINYRTLKPEREGLFCERIFGPTKDWECYCGKYKRVRYKGIVCEKCGVEVTRSKVRRERMGHVDLAAPVSHIWFFKGVPSRIGYLLDMAPKELEKVLYYAASIITWVDQDARRRDLDDLRGQVQADLDEMASFEDDEVSTLERALEHRTAWLQGGDQGDFDDDDHLWAQSLDITVGKLTEEERKKHLTDVRKHLSSEIEDLRAHYAEGRERLREAWKLFANADEPSEDPPSEHEEWPLTAFVEKADDKDQLAPKTIIADESFFRELKSRFGSPYGYGEYFGGGMGAEFVRELLRIKKVYDRDEPRPATNADREAGDKLDVRDAPGFCLHHERLDLEDLVKNGKGQKQQRAVKRLKVLSAFYDADNGPWHSRDNTPEMMILDAVPVIPPDLRPMVQLDGGRFATSDLNDLYRRVINRNNRLKKLLDLGAPEIIVSNEKRMLQESVDALFDNGRRGRPVTGPGNRALKSLSDMLKGKQGRFRQNLLGKRVDYSGRSVIVSGPSLRLHQCGLPKLMALELFKPFIMAQLVERKEAQNIKASKKMVDTAVPQVWDVLEEVIQEHPVLLNRAPTLHRLGIQAFEPKLVEGKAIQVHPLVCAAFNADFDGDQMAVHLPLSAEAQAEARILMLSSNNILSPSSGAPLATPSQDMVIGGYYLTLAPDGKVLDGPELEEMRARLYTGDWDEATDGPTPKVFRDAAQAELALAAGRVALHEIVELRPLDRAPVLTTVGRVIYNDRIERALAEAVGEQWDPSQYHFMNQAMRKKDAQRFIDTLVQLFGAGAIARVLDAFKDVGFDNATRSGVTVSKNDVIVPPDKAEILDRYDNRVLDVEGQYEDGLITEQERYELVVQQWTDATEEVAGAMEKHFDRRNPIFMMADSGARGSIKQIRQLAGMRGLMANPKGETIERPIKANFMEGLSVLEYFISTHGARKGLADTALRTADSGYLTRRLVDVAQDVIIREEDCGTEGSIELDVVTPTGELNDNLVGRFTARAYAVEGSEVVGSGVEITREQASQIFEASRAAHEAGERPRVALRTPLKCEAEVGICQTCYGRSLATNALAQIGDAVGIVAAQSIGEPGTQLTMRTFHTGGVAGGDITQGLPRVVELFEARKPKGLARIAEQGGAVTVESDDKSLTVVVTDDAGDEHRYTFPRRTRLHVADGERIEPGHQLNEGALYPHDLLALRGRAETEGYLVKEVQSVYKTQGVDINDKHIELIVRQMLKRIRVEQKGDLDYLPGQFVDRNEFFRANAEVAEQGGEQAAYEEVILGITKASLNTDSFLSAASFQETTKVLTDAALEGKRDNLAGLKENVIIGKLIPAATGLKRYRRIEIEPTDPLPHAVDGGLLDGDDLLGDFELGEEYEGVDVDEDIRSLERLDPGVDFGDELAELDVDPAPPTDRG